MSLRIGRPLLAASFIFVLSQTLLGQLDLDSRKIEGRVLLNGSLNPVVANKQDRGPVNPGQKLSQLTLIFRRTLEQASALDRFLDELQDLSSPNFHKWLTPEEFGDRFSVSAENLQRVVEWLESQGLVLNSVGRGRGWVIFTGTPERVQNAFRTELHNFDSDGQEHYAPVSVPSVPTELGDLIGGIRGLDDFFMEPYARLQPLATSTDGKHALAPGDVDIIYYVPESDTNGSGIKIAVAGASAVNIADIRQFRTMFQLPTNDPTLVLTGDDPGTVSGAMQEADSDIEWAGGIAPGASIVYVYAKDPMTAAQYAIDKNLAPILTFSFGSCEANISSDNVTFIHDLARQANAQGITWVAASGDAGAATCDPESNIAKHGLAVSFPASIPEVTGVGGTEFNEPDGSWSLYNLPNLTSVFGYLPEVGWNDTSSTRLRASGGGASALFAKPSWQVGPGVPGDGKRDVPDIALDASPQHDPYLVISGGKTYAAGGTSLSTPVFAGMLAYAEQVGRSNGDITSGFGNINPSLYALAGNLSGSGIFNDITTGNNIVPCAIGTPDCTNGSLGYQATPGYDLVTGLGSIDGGFAEVLRRVTSTKLTASATHIAEGTPITINVAVVDYNGTTPTGSVDLFDGNNHLVIDARTGNYTLILDGSGMSSVTFLPPPGAHSITARFFNICCNLLSSVSPPVTVDVIPAAPHAPGLASPANGATNTSVSVSLTWNSVPFATSYDVYFGTSPSPPFWGNVETLQCTPGALAPNTKYYWKVAARNVNGATPSDFWSFATTKTLYTISTIAGSNVAGLSPDGIPAVDALLSGPIGVAVDASGNVYVADTGNNRIRRISTAGIISTVAGGGTGGDGVQATSASLSYPYAIALDSQGNLYISENYTRVRMVSPSGIITTIAGGAQAGYSGDGGPAVDARLSGPTGLAVDSAGDLFIADTGNGCIRKVLAGIISTVAGICATLSLVSQTHGDGGPATSAALVNPAAIGADLAGDLYIADYYNRSIRKVTNGIINTVAGSTGYAQSLGLDLQGNLYVAFGFDFGYNSTVALLTNGVVTTIAGGGITAPADGGPGTSAMIAGAAGLAVDSSGKIYFTENAKSSATDQPLSERVRMLTPSTAYTPPPPSITSGGVLNAASFATPPLSPGSLATVFGTFGFASPALSNGTPLPTALSGLSLEVGSSIKAPLFFASTGQINMQLPWELSGQASAAIQPLLNGEAGLSQQLPLAPFSPGIFKVGDTQGAVVDSLGQIIDPSNAVPSGTFIQIYCTGLGLVTNQPASGNAASTTTLSETLAKPTVTIGGVPAKVVFSGLAPGTVGEYQVNVQVPNGITPGNAVPLVLTIGGVASNTVTISIR